MADGLNNLQKYLIFVPLTTAYDDVVNATQENSRGFEAGARSVIRAINKYVDAFNHARQQMRDHHEYFDEGDFLSRAEAAASANTKGRSDYKFAVIRAKLGL